MYHVDGFVAETAATKADDIDTAVACRLLACNNIRRYVETEAASALNHNISANVAELMAQDCCTDDCIVVNNDFACKLGGVADDTSVANLAVVGNVHVLHKEIAVANHCLALAGSATTDGDVLADTVIIADDAERFLAAELEVLWLCAYACSGKKTRCCCLCGHRYG